MYYSSYLVMVAARNLKKKCRRHIFFDSCPDFIHTVLKKKTTFFPLKSFPLKKKKKEQRTSDSSHLG